MIKNKILVIVSFVFLLFLAIVVFSFVNKKEIGGNTEEKLKVITTLFPLYDIAKNIGGEKAEVSLLLPPGVEAHAYEPKPSDILKINEADIFIYTGEFMEPWVHDMINSIDSDVRIIDASLGVSLFYEDGHEHKEDGVEDEHNHGGVDPHIWLDFEKNKIISSNIKEVFVSLGLENKEFYENNLEKYKSGLDELDELYKDGLSSCKTRDMIYGGHYTFGYLARKYNLRYIAAQGLAPDSEPTASDLVRLVEQIKKEKVDYIFYEELESPKIAETLSKETEAGMIALNSAHNIAKDQMEAGISFFEIMKTNLYNLKKGLLCEN